MALEFSTNARSSIVQEIPVVNNTDQAWQIRAELVGEGFSGPSTVTVGPGQTGQYPLQFSPAWICSVKGKLTLTNATTRDQYLYELAGTGEEPVAHDRVQLQCQARTTSSVAIRVPNIGGRKECAYRVETDLAFVSGPAEWSFAGDSGTYEIQVTPNRSGRLPGTITFVAPNGQYVWFIIEVEASPPDAVSTITLSTAIRKAVVVDIDVTNPLPDPVGTRAARVAKRSRVAWLTAACVWSAELDVELVGAGLVGEQVLALGPSEQRPYELAFSPLDEGTWQGRITFFNEQLGEFWYQLVCIHVCARAECGPPLTDVLNSRS